MQIESRVALPRSQPPTHQHAFNWSHTDCDSLVKKLSVRDRLRFAADADLLNACNDISRESFLDATRVLSSLIDIPKKFYKQLTICKRAADLESFLQKESKGTLPGLHESIFISFPDLQIDSDSLKLELIDNVRNKTIPFFDIPSFKGSAEICLPKVTLDDASPLKAPPSDLMDCLAQKYNPLQELQRLKDFTYDRFESGIAYALEELRHPSHIQCWNQSLALAVKTYKETIQSNYDILLEQIMKHLRNRCQIFQKGSETYSFTIGDCDLETVTPRLTASTPSTPHSAIYAVGLFTILIVGGVIALWSSHNQAKSDLLKNQIVDLSHRSKREKEDFLIKIDRFLKTSGKYEQFKSDRDRLVAVLQGIEDEWVHLNPEFRKLLGCYLKIST